MKSLTCGGDFITNKIKLGGEEVNLAGYAALALICAVYIRNSF
jgi:hypothetical protein